ncbi:competence type IV pilus minor pilin ComGE [Falsibacillus pallidus]|uniref:competence type IV pilus minor pilin ComGE n=1 Tax=Falsibacillus pallidus TaxID=493781 RepID=UPI000E0B6053|nr:competence type IV pilus minor pilin ComGE [Falsibacillus pallidus]
MFNNSESGFSLVESIISFSLIIMLVSSLLPLLQHLSQDLKNMKLKMDAYRILYEQVEMMALNSIYQGTVIENQSEYGVQVDKDLNGDWFACVKYMDASNQNVRTCFNQNE